jgi:hypothetical protein
MNNNTIDKELKKLLDNRSKLQRLISQTAAQERLVRDQEKSVSALLAGKPQAQAQEDGAQS